MTGTNAWKYKNREKAMSAAFIQQSKPCRSSKVPNIGRSVETNINQRGRPTGIARAPLNSLSKNQQ